MTYKLSTVHLTKVKAFQPLSLKNNDFVLISFNITAPLGKWS